jgi:hypothetical protein
LVAVAATIAGAYVLLPFVVWLLARLLSGALSGSVWVAAAFSSGEDGWTIMTTVLRASAGVLATPQVSGGIVGLIVLAAAATYGLQRLLGSEEESSQ